ncbi:3-(methylthio)propionyl-CoA ligase [Azohydromonas caseinilytica]|uniref:Long-chain-fatty-acid--CoA ligase n=1 Tax=Azohydromonas caseinilytica TaxID=2728836 RepID=A0A848F7D6_9BURK|nr:3-(methylthio)propionyl-CoA ligase [Azohydromonas caseinilytica]NML14469.1 long-chain-fatty-acid--CoA ligase [Azohydromonas caseinilytica]
MTAPLYGRMMQMPLLISSLITHAARHAGDTEIVTRRVEGPLHRSSWSQVEQRARRFAQALQRLGCESGDRVATLAWNTDRHLEIYYATSGSQLVCHTINPRLFPQQIAWIANDAADKVLCFDLNLLPLVEQLAPQLGTVRHFVLMTDRAHMPAQSAVPNLLCYEELLAAEDGRYAWPSFDEQCASSLCYSSGTTGNPKGALYSHRSTVLHAYAAALPDAMAASACDVILPAVPMFHVNAWGLPYTAALVGCKLVLPGPKLDGASLYELFEGEKVTFSAGVPTLWLGLMEHVRSRGLEFSTFRRTVIGGSACPPALMRALEEYGVHVIHAWGMTEMSPLGTLARLQPKHATLPAAERHRLLEKQGKAIYGVDIDVINDAHEVLPWDSQQAGHLVARGPWVIERYWNEDSSPLVEVKDHGAWFPTGDVATMDADGFMQITDRSKDVVKSGGEWISSIELENIAMAHPAVKEAAVIAATHPVWDERPLLLAQLKPGASVTREELLSFFKGRIAHWQTPDDVVFVDELPHTATGKLSKLTLRGKYKDWLIQQRG